MDQGRVARSGTTDAFRCLDVVLGLVAPQMGVADRLEIAILVSSGSGGTGYPLREGPMEELTLLKEALQSVGDEREGEGEEGRERGACGWGDGRVLKIP